MSTKQCPVCTFVNNEGEICTMCNSPLKKEAKNLVRCPSCTFENVSSLGSCELCDTMLPVETIGGKILLEEVMTTEIAAEATSELVEALAAILGVSIALTVLHGDFRNKVTKTGDLVVTLVQVGRRYGHYHLLFRGKELDMGQYNIDPRGLKGFLRKKYDAILKKNNWQTRCNNCCFPMCIIVGVLLEQHYQEHPNSRVLSDICNAQERLLVEEEEQNRKSLRIAKDFKREFDKAKEDRLAEEKEGLQLALKLQQEEDRMLQQCRGRAPWRPVPMPQQQPAEAKAKQLEMQLEEEEKLFKPHVGKLDLPGSGYVPVKQLDTKEGAILLCTNRFGPFVIKWNLSTGKWEVAYHRFKSTPQVFKLGKDKIYHIYFPWQDSRVFRRRG